jgi:hypothetical protein
MGSHSLEVSMCFASALVARLLVGLTLVVVVSAVSVAVGCGSTETVTVTEEASPPETVIEKAPAKQKKKSRAAAAPQDSSGGQGEAGVVPDLVGVDHQLAQDTLQAEGFYFIEETDCSGQDRLLLWDRNWTVVEQNPQLELTRASTIRSPSARSRTARNDIGMGDAYFACLRPRSSCSGGRLW